MIWLDRGIWNSCDDDRVQATARNITDRIKSVDYASKGLTPMRAANIILNAVSVFEPSEMPEIISKQNF